MNTQLGVKVIIYLKLDKNYNKLQIFKQLTNNINITEPFKNIIFTKLLDIFLCYFPCISECVFLTIII